MREHISPVPCLLGAGKAGSGVTVQSYRDTGIGIPRLCAPWSSVRNLCQLLHLLPHQDERERQAAATQLQGLQRKLGLKVSGRLPNPPWLSRKTESRLLQKLNHISLIYLFFSHFNSSKRRMHPVNDDVPYFKMASLFFLLVVYEIAVCLQLMMIYAQKNTLY